jgi:hypothetical protein
MKNDLLVTAVFAAINREHGSPEERRMGLVRAGAIAQIYQGSLLVDALFAGDSALHDYDDLHGSSGCGDTGTDQDGLKALRGVFR